MISRDYPEKISVLDEAHVPGARNVPNQNGSTYALLAAVSDYSGTEMSNLPAGPSDLALMRMAVTKGLCIEEEHVRVLGETGTVTMAEYVRALKEFKDLLGGGDTFVLYFSGHGSAGAVWFSDGSVTLESLMKVLDGMPARSKVLILDTCFSGSAARLSAPQFSMDDSVAEAAGRGAAVLAAAAPDEAAWLSPGRSYSLYTEAVCAAMISRRGVRRGRKSIADISDEIRVYMKSLTAGDEAATQHPYFQSSMVGTVYFRVAEDEHRGRFSVSDGHRGRFSVSDWNRRRSPVPVADGSIEHTEPSPVFEVRSLSTGNVRRLAAFLRTERVLNTSEIAAVTKEAAEELKHSSVYRDEAEEARFRGVDARAVWCYFAQDEMDLFESTYYAYGLWAADDEMRAKLFHSKRNTCVVDGIYIYKNPSYDQIRRMRAANQASETYKDEMEHLEHLVVNRAEGFISDLNRWMNGEIGYEYFRDSHREWYTEVWKTYNRLMDSAVPPAALHEWSEMVLDLAGWVMNMAIPLDSRAQYSEESIRFLLRGAVREYYETLEKMKRLT